ncbi:MAG: hypothetical protein P4L51_18290 [Puia sp.]|nr:hypothetical protein [Puia sp.]
MIKPLTALLLSPLFLSAQERKDDHPPQIKQLASIASMVGWTKNDLGKWSSNTNALPRYIHDYFFSLCEQILKIDLAEIQYKDKKMLCVAKFMQHKYVRFGKIHIEYPVNYWLFDFSGTDTLIGEIPTVQAITYRTFESGFFSGVTVPTWREVSNDIIVHSENGLGLEGDFCIQIRENKKDNKIQFLIGSYNHTIHQFDFNDCTMPGDNNEMANGYYEVPSAIFLAFLKKIQP